MCLASDAENCSKFEANFTQRRLSVVECLLENDGRNVGGSKLGIYDLLIFGSYL